MVAGDGQVPHPPVVDLWGGAAVSGYGQLTGLVKPSQLGTEFMGTPLPGAKGGYSTLDGGGDFAIPAGAKNGSGAWEFIQWVTQTQQQPALQTP